MIDDCPHTGALRAVKFDKDGQMRVRIIRRDRITSEPLLSNHEASKS
jgi:hypothetical protein